jgi:hypothetical protein
MSNREVKAMNTKNNEKFISKANKKRLLLLVNVILMIALVTVATYAWFSRNTIDTVNVDEIAFDGSTDLEVSLDNKNFSFHQTWNNASTKTLSKEITGDGVLANFRKVTTKASSSNETILVPNTDEVSSWTTVTENEQYITKTIYFRSKEKMEVYLGSGSYIKGADEIAGNSLVGSSVSRESTVTDAKNSSGTKVKMSKDCIVGATRIAFLTDSSATSSNFVWIPRANLFYDTTATTKTIYGGTSYDAGNLTTTDYNSNNPMSPYATVHYYYDTSGTAKEYDSQKTAAGTDGLASGSKTGIGSVATVETKKDTDDGYYYGHAEVVIWIEGCDAEARRAFAGGKFGVHFQFIGFSTSSAS